MPAAPFDTLKLAKSLSANAHFSKDQSEALATALAEAFLDQLATKNDLLLLEQRLTNKIDRMTIAIGGMLVASVTVLATLEKSYLTEGARARCGLSPGSAPRRPKAQGGSGNEAP